jgi:D-alanyl-lipoteichoic acid acyltransferase DltB (MBOAT superfamily)
MKPLPLRNSGSGRTRADQGVRPTQQPEPSWGRALRIFCTYQFVCLTWVFFRAASLPDALSILSRIASLTTGIENVSWPLAGVLLIAAASMFTGKKLYSQTMDLFANSPFYVHAAALALVAVALQLLGGRGSTPFVYSRF